MVQGASKIVKFLLFFFNLVFVITGLALIIVGAVVEARARNYLNFLGDSYVSTAVLVIILGVVLFIVAFLGCCGAYKENYTMMITFTVFLVVLFIMELAAGIAAYAYRNKMDDIVEDGLHNMLSEALKEHEQGSRSDGIKGWEGVQHQFDCCGVKGKEDYVTNATAPEDTFVFPSCCKHLVGNDTNQCPYNSEEIYEQGCYHSVIGQFKDSIAQIGGAGIGVAFIQVIGIVLASCLARAIKREYEVV